MEFQGFSPETIDFLWGIRMNNNREWFTAHKTEYTKYLVEPMKAMARDVSEPFKDIPGFLCKTSRIYKDMRMHPPVPYKESLWTCLRREESWWQQEPTLCFEIRPEGFRFGFLFYAPTVPMMNAMRKHMGEHPDEFLKLVHQVEKNSGIPIEGTYYVKKKPCPDARLEPYYQLRNVMAIRDLPVTDELFKPELAELVRETLVAQYPLCQYCQKFTQP